MMSEQFGRAWWELMFPFPCRRLLTEAVAGNISAVLRERVPVSAEDVSWYWALSVLVELWFLPECVPPGCGYAGLQVPYGITRES